MRSRGSAGIDASKAKRGARTFEGSPRGEGVRVAVAVSRYHDDITERLLQGALQALSEAGVRDGDVEVLHVPGSFELGLAVDRACKSGRYAAVVALGCLVQGETIHMDIIAREVVRSLGESQRSTGVPVGFGLLTVNDLVQAEARAGGAEGNKGHEAAQAALCQIVLFRDAGIGHGR